MTAISKSNIKVLTLHGKNIITGYGEKSCIYLYVRLQRWNIMI